MSSIVSTLYMWIEGLDGQSYSSNQATSSDWNDNGIDVLYLNIRNPIKKELWLLPEHKTTENTNLFNNFESHSSLSSNDVRVIIAVDVSQVPLLGQSHGLFAGFSNIHSMDNDVGAELAAGLDLHDGRHDWHHHRHRNTQFLTVVRESQSMIPG